MQSVLEHNLAKEGWGPLGEPRRVGVVRRKAAEEEEHRTAEAVAGHRLDLAKERHIVANILAVGEGTAGLVTGTLAVVDGEEHRTAEEEDLHTEVAVDMLDCIALAAALKVVGNPLAVHILEGVRGSYRSHIEEDNFEEGIAGAEVAGREAVGIPLQFYQHDRKGDGD